MRFANSTIRKVIIPYPDDSDFEDAQRPPHWLENIHNQARGLDNRRPRSSKYGTSSPNDHHDMLWTSPFHSTQASTDNGEYDSLTEDDHDGSPANSASQQRHSARQSLWSQNSHKSSGLPAVIGLPPQRPSYGQQGRSKTLARSLPAPTLSKTHSQSHKKPTSESPSSPKLKKSGRRHQRHHSMPSPLTPAQPLNQVNTFLPLRIPPPDLRAQNPPVCFQGFHSVDQQEQFTIRGQQKGHTSQFQAQRREEAHSVSVLLPARHDQVSSLSSSSRPSSSDGTSVMSVESDGSFHGDVGDNDPDSQLAAGIAKLKAARRDQAQKEAQRPSWITQDRPQIITDADDDLQTTREIREHSGILTSLADLVLELRITRNGAAFRNRSVSYTDVSDLHNLPARSSSNHNGVQMSRTQSADALPDAWASARRPTTSSNLLGSGVSTPYELRDEVIRWSRRRNMSIEATTTSSEPKLTAALDTLLGYIPFASTFKTHLAQLQSILPISEAPDDVETSAPSASQDDNVRTAHASSRTEETCSDSEDDSEGLAGTKSTGNDALSSLWASPVVSRSASHYNLQLLSDEPSVFEEHSTDSNAGSWRCRYPGRDLSAFTQLGGDQAGKKRPREEQKPKLTFTVSPLWDEGRIEDDEATREQTAQKAVYVRSWSSVLGMAA